MVTTRKREEMTEKKKRRGERRELTQGLGKGDERAVN